ncbi:hypothetical protein RHMOL_Rhmol09G0210300 [Rhododendron molle]|uniref:Uncharacterized protein n=1 Tax=Rhododendron molle TaxID=49168 RepID=A0ACC0MG36_RHOML|nr:hypothetical protein RHMOL_Rhmol09G0210300 [Rhododendron molle]
MAILRVGHRTCRPSAVIRVSGLASDGDRKISSLLNFVLSSSSISSSLIVFCFSDWAPTGSIFVGRNGHDGGSGGLTRGIWLCRPGTRGGLWRSSTGSATGVGKSGLELRTRRCCRPQFRGGFVRAWRQGRERDFVSTVIGFFGFGVGISIGLVVGYYLFIFFQPSDIKGVHIV